MEAAHIFLVLLVSGLMLVGAEIFVPGGILGVFGGIALLGACITGFVAFPEYGGYIAAGIVLLVAAAIFLWIKIFPNSSVGKRMTVSGDLHAAKAADNGLKQLVGLHGTAASELRPAGFATIDGRRVDVVTQGGMIEHGAALVVVEVKGSRVVVRKAETAPSELS